MYGLIWHVIPGPWFVKLVVFLALLAAVLWALWYVAFPWIDPYMPFNDGAVEAPGHAPDGAPID